MKKVQLFADQSRDYQKVSNYMFTRVLPDLKCPAAFAVLSYLMNQTVGHRDYREEATFSDKELCEATGIKDPRTLQTYIEKLVEKQYLHTPRRAKGSKYTRYPINVDKTIEVEEEAGPRTYAKNAEVEEETSANDAEVHAKNAEVDENDLAKNAEVQGSTYAKNAEVETPTYAKNAETSFIYKDMGEDNPKTSAAAADDIPPDDEPFDPEEAFAELAELYPEHKRDTEDAKPIFMALNLDHEGYLALMGRLSEWVESWDWKKKQGWYVPWFSKWLYLGHKQRPKEPSRYSEDVGWDYSNALQSNGNAVPNGEKSDVDILFEVARQRMGGGQI